MKQQITIVFYLCITVGFFGCGLFTKKGEDSTAYIPNAIKIGLAATPDLNFYNNQAHAVTVTFYELAKTDAFTRMLTSREGRSQLVIGTEFDKSVLSHRSLVLQPGEFREQLLDREEGARYIAAVAGYYQDDPRQISIVYPIKIGTKTNFFWRNLGDAPQMIVNIRLSKDGIANQRTTKP